MKFNKATHVIFDLDGTIIESESIYETILGRIAKRYGKRYTEDVKAKILGTPEADTTRIFLSELNIDIKPEEFIRQYYNGIEEEMQYLTLMPGVEKLIKHLYSHNIPIAIATSSSQFSYDIKTRKHKELFKLFHHVVCGTTDPEVKHGKPAPDIFLVCASRFPDNPNPSQVLVMEDAPNGVRGALAAGMQAILIPEDDVKEELRKPSTLVLKSLVDFQPELFGLPPYDN